MMPNVVIMKLSRTGKKEFDVFLVSVECKYSCSRKVDTSANNQTRAFLRMIIWDRHKKPHNIGQLFGTDII